MFDNAVLEEIKKLKKENEKVVNISDYPSWIYVYRNEKKVKVPELARTIMKEVPMIRCAELMQGGRFDKIKGFWRMEDLSDYMDKYITNKLDKEKLWNTKYLNNTKTFLMSQIFNENLFESPFHNSKPELVNFNNGTYNILTGEMKKHNPLDYIGQTHNYGISPDKMKFPVKTIQWLEEMTADKESAQYLFELIGYCFYRSYEPFQNFTILQGGGGNGKSTFINHLTDIIGERNVSNASLADIADGNNRFAKSMLFQKEVNAFADIDSSFLKSTSIIKALTGWDKIFAEYKGRDPFMFKNFAKLIFSANKLPAFNDFTEGFKRRVNIVEFPHKLDDEFKKKYDLSAIKAEIPDFTLFCMNEFKKAYERGYMTESESMKQAKDKWLKESNHVERFIDEYCDIDKTSEEGVSSRLVYEKYKDYCFDESVKALSQPNFTKELESMGIFRKQSRIDGIKARRYIHLSLKTDI